MELKYLREIGLTDSEIKVYLATLDLGDSTKGKIVYNSGVTGSKIYEILERLREKGLITVYKKNNKKHFKATNPKQIMNYLESKKEKIQYVENKIELLLPKLMMKYEESKKEQEVGLLTGLKGLEIIFREQVDILNQGEENLVIGGTKGVDEEAVMAFFQKIHLLRAEKKIKTKMLYNKRQKISVEKQFANYKFTEIKYISHTSPVAINIYKNKTAIIAFGEKINTILITSEEITNSFKEYFKMLWKEAKK